MRALLVAVAFALVPTLAPATPPAMQRPTHWSHDVHAYLAFVGGFPGEESSVEAYIVTYHGEVEPFEVDPAKVHVDRAAVDGHVERRDVGRIGGLRSWSPASDYTTHAQLSVVVPRSMLRRGMQLLVLRLEPGTVTRGGAAQTFAAEDEPLGRRSRRVYVPEPDTGPAAVADLSGADVTTRETLRLHCDLPADFVAWFDAQPDARFRIATVTREIGHAAVLQLETDAGRTWNSTYKALDPLHVRIDRNHRPPVGQPTVVSRRFPPAGPPPRRTGPDVDHCTPLEFFAADRADLGRMIALP
jgi:hypothetical protein